jgi:hypothetical protein
MITFKHKGDFSKTLSFFNAVLNKDYLNVIEHYAKRGVELLAEVTPKRTGLTAASWSYEIKEKSSGEITISFLNSNIQNGENIAIILDVGHGTSRGGWVQGRHYIDPIVQPIFDEMAQDAWREVTRL